MLHLPIGGEERRVVADFAEVVVDDAFDAGLPEFPGAGFAVARLFLRVEEPEAIPAERPDARAAPGWMVSSDSAQADGGDGRVFVPPRFGGVQPGQRSEQQGG